MRRIRKYIKEVLLALLDTVKLVLLSIWLIIEQLDRVINAFCFGDRRETISSRCGKKVRDYGNKYKFSYYLCKLLSLIDHRHCEESIENENK